MANFPGFINLSPPPSGDAGRFPSPRNAGALYLEKLTLPGLTVGLPVWLFSNSVVPSMSADTTSVPLPAQHPVEPQVDPTPSTPTSTTPSSLGGSTQVANKKKKK